MGNLDYEKVHEREQAIWSQVHSLVNKMTVDLSPDEDDEVRQRLTETFRFWRTP